MRKINVHEIIDNSKMNVFFIFIWTVTFFTLIFDGYDLQVFGVAMPSMMKEMGYGPALSGLIGSASLWGAIAGAIIFGILTDKWGRKPIHFIAVSLFSIFTAVAAVSASNIPVFVGSRFIAGMGIATITPTVQSLLSEYTPANNRRFLLTANMIGIAVGNILAPLLALVVLPVFGWRAMFGLAALGLVMVPFILKLPETMVHNVKKGQKKEIASILSKADPNFVPQADDEYVVNEAQTVKLSAGALFRDGLAWNTILIWVMFFANMFVIASFQIWLPKLITMMNYSLTNALLLTALMLIGAIVGSVLAGYIATKAGYKKTLIIFYILTGVFLLLLTLKTSLTIFAIILFFYGCSNIMQNLMYPFTTTVYPISVRATGLGMGASMTRVGGALAPIVVGFVVAAGMGAVSVFYLMTIPVVLGLCAAILIRKPKFDNQ